MKSQADGKYLTYSNVYHAIGCPTSYGFLHQSVLRMIVNR